MIGVGIHLHGAAAAEQSHQRLSLLGAHRIIHERLTAGSLAAPLSLLLAVSFSLPIAPAVTSHRSS